MPRLLISNNHLRRHAGSEMVTLELTEEFVRRGWNVDVATNLFLPPFSEEFGRYLNSGIVRASNDPYPDFGLDYDLIWVHHNLLPPSTIKAMAASEFEVPVVWHHMSPIAEIEFPLLVDIENSIADRMTFMSPATKDALLEFGLDATRALVLPNPVPHNFVSRQPLQPSSSLRALAVVSNHVPDEVYHAARLLRSEGIKVEFIGGDTPQRMSPTVLQSFDAVLTIGKTVQYALTLGIPAYVYDHFGGDGWLFEANFEEMSRTNFSGRNSHRRISGSEIKKELIEGYASGRNFAVTQLTENRTRYSLPAYIDSLLAEDWVQNPRKKQLSKAQELRWLSFSEQFRGLYRELEYYKDLATKGSGSSRVLPATTQFSDGAFESLNEAEVELSGPLVKGTVAVLMELDRQSLSRSIFALKSQTSAPLEIHLFGPDSLTKEALSELREWADDNNTQVTDIPAAHSDSLAQALNYVSQRTRAEALAVLEHQSSWLHTYLTSGLNTLSRYTDAAVVLRHSILAFTEPTNNDVQYYFDHGPPRDLSGPLLVDELLEIKALPLSNLLIRTSCLLEIGDTTNVPASIAAHVLLLRLSRSNEIVMSDAYDHSEVVHFRPAGASEIADRQLIDAASEQDSRELVDSLMKSALPSDNSFAVMLDRKRSQDSIEEIAEYSESAIDRLDLLIQRLPSVGFEERLRSWASSFPARARRVIRRRSQSLLRRSTSDLHGVRPTTARKQETDDPLSLISGSDVISFDVFDTLLDRPILRPFDVFTLAAEAVHRNHNRWITPEWPEQRMAAELHCYSKSGVGPDITIEDIYNELDQRNIVDTATLSLLQEAELAVEVQLLSATTRGSRLFQEARRLEKKILLVSDMYLPKQTIVTALTNAGYSGWDRLIVSGYDKIGKHSGTAFGRITQDYPGKQIVHFGDNAIADVIQPRHYGISSRLLPRPRDLTSGNAGGVNTDLLRADADRLGFSKTEVSCSLIGGMVERRLDRVPHRDAISDIGYSVLGPALVALSQWLDNQARANGTQRLLFLAREGKLMMRAYETLWGDKGIEAEYVYASRRMINLTQVEDRLTDAALDFLTATGTPLSVSDYVRRFVPDVSDERLTSALTGTTLSPATILGPDRGAEVRAVFLRLEDELIGTISSERGRVLDYLRSVGADRSDVGVVDIGWQGSIQRSIEKSLNPQLLGYYFAVHDLPTTRNRDSLYGFIDPRKDPSAADWYQSSIIPGIEIIELLFANPDEASVSSVERVGEGFGPVYSSEKLGSNEASQVRNLQTAALDFVQDFAHLSTELTSGVPLLTPEAALAPLAALITHPTATQADTIGQFPHDNSLGIVATPLGMPTHSAEFYRKNPSVLQTDYDAAWWKPGFRVNAETRDIIL